MTRSERLTAVLVKTGAATQEEIDTGQWSENKCPYTIRTVPVTLADKTVVEGRRIDIDKGDVLLRATAATLDAAVAILETKAGIVAPENKPEVQG